MLGSRGNVIRINETRLTDYVEKIKKVDIDIFQSGVTDNVLNVYDTTVQTEGTSPIKLLFADKNKLIVHLRVDVREGFKVRSFTLNDDTNVVAQKVVDEDDEYYLAIVYMPEAGPEHFRLVIENIDNPEDTRSYDYNLYVRAHDVKSGTNTDIPVDSYRDALLNVTKLWLLSSKYDRVRHPDWAGFFDDRLRRYPMNDEGAKQVQVDLTNAILEKVKGVYISNVTAKPLLAERGWDVGVTSADTDTGITTDTQDTNKGLQFRISTDDDTAIDVKKVST